MKFRFFTALLIAAAFSYREPKASFRRLSRLVTFWFGSSGEKAGDELAARRLVVCQQCSLYAPRWMTCGTPLRPKGERTGCHCFMPEKVKSLEAECFLDEVFGDSAPSGWKKSGVE